MARLINLIILLSQLFFTSAFAANAIPCSTLPQGALTAARIQIVPGLYGFCTILTCRPGFTLSSNNCVAPPAPTWVGSGRAVTLVSSPLTIRAQLNYPAVQDTKFPLVTSASLLSSRYYSTSSAFVHFPAGSAVSDPITVTYAPPSGSGDSSIVLSINSSTGPTMSFTVINPVPTVIPNQYIITTASPTDAASVTLPLTTITFPSKLTTLFPTWITVDFTLKSGSKTQLVTQNLTIFPFQTSISFIPALSTAQLGGSTVTISVEKMGGTNAVVNILVPPACDQSDYTENGVNSSGANILTGQRFNSDVSQCLISSCNPGYDLSSDMKTCTFRAGGCSTDDYASNGVNLLNSLLVVGDEQGTDLSACLIGSCVPGYDLSTDKKTCSLHNAACSPADYLANGVNPTSANLVGNVVGTDQSACLVGSCNPGYSPAVDSKSCVFNTGACSPQDFLAVGINPTGANLTGNENGTDLSACAISSCKPGYNIAADSNSCILNTEPCTTADYAANGINSANAITNANESGTSIAACVISACKPGFNLAGNQKSCIFNTNACTALDYAANGIISANANLVGSESGTSIAACQIGTCKPGYNLAGNQKSCILNTATCTTLDDTLNGVISLNALTLTGSESGLSISACLIGTCQPGYNLASDSKSCIFNTNSCVAADYTANLVNTANKLTLVGNESGTSVTSCLIGTCQPGYNLATDKKSCSFNTNSCTTQDYTSNGVTTTNQLTLVGNESGTSVTSCLIGTCQPGYNLATNQKSCSLNTAQCTTADYATNGVTSTNQLTLVGNESGLSVSACLIGSCQPGFNLAIDKKSCSFNTNSCTTQDYATNLVTTTNNLTLVGNESGTSVAACLIGSCKPGFNLATDKKSCPLNTAQCTTADYASNLVTTTNSLTLVGNESGLSVSACLISACQPGYNLATDKKSCPLNTNSCTAADDIANGVSSVGAQAFTGNESGTSVAACLISFCQSGYNISTDKKSCIFNTNPCTAGDYLANGIVSGNANLVGNESGTSIAACQIGSCQLGYNLASNSKSCIFNTNPCTTADYTANGIISANANLVGSESGTSIAACQIGSCQLGYNLASNSKSCVFNTNACTTADYTSNGVVSLNTLTLIGNESGTSIAACLIGTCQPGYSLASDSKSCPIINRACLSSDFAANGGTIGNIATYAGNVLGTNISSCLVGVCSTGYQAATNLKSCELIIRACTSADAQTNGINTINVTAVQGNVLIATDTSNCSIKTCVTGYVASSDGKSCVGSRNCTLTDAQANGANINQATSATGIVATSNISQCLIGSCNGNYTVASNGLSCTPVFTGGSFFQPLLSGINATNSKNPPLSFPTATLIQDGYNLISITNGGTTCTSAFVAYNSAQTYYASNSTVGSNTVNIQFENSSTGSKSACQTVYYQYTATAPFAQILTTGTQVTNNPYSAPQIHFTGNTAYTQYGSTVTISTTPSLAGAVGNTVLFPIGINDQSPAPVGYQVGSGYDMYVTGSTLNGAISTLLSENTQYYVVITVIDGAGNSSTAASVPFTYVRTPFLYFTADNGLNGQELWQVNTVYGGVKMIKDFTPGIYTDPRTGVITPNSSNFYGMAVYNDALYILVQDVDTNNQLTNAIALWTYNSSYVFTKIKSIPIANSTPVIEHESQMVVYNGRLVFPIYGGGTSGIGTLQFWSTDGTTAGTNLLVDTGYQPTAISNMKVNGQYIYYAISNSFLANTNLANLATTTNVGFNSGIIDYTFYNGSVYVDGTNSSSDNGLYKINSAPGTAVSNTSQTTKIAQGIIGGQFLVANNLMYFSATNFNTNVGQNKLWSSNGSTTTKLFDLNGVSGNDGVTTPTVLNGVVTFWAYNGTLSSTGSQIQIMYSLSGSTPTEIDYGARVLADPYQHQLDFIQYNGAVYMNSYNQTLAPVNPIAYSVWASPDKTSGVSWPNIYWNFNSVNNNFNPQLFISF